jgi:hypothetical protein
MAGGEGKGACGSKVAPRAPAVYVAAKAATYKARVWMNCGSGRWASICG